MTVPKPWNPTSARPRCESLKLQGTDTFPGMALGRKASCIFTRAPWAFAAAGLVLPVQRGDQVLRPEGIRPLRPLRFPPRSVSPLMMAAKSGYELMI